MTRESTETIGLFGGSFNPPHICHTLATVWVSETHKLDEIHWIPAYKHAFSKKLVSFEHRMAMSKLATNPLTDVRVSRIEEEIGGESRTIDTVKKLRESHTDKEFSLIIGSDILDQTDDWKKWDRLTSLVDLIVIGRAEHDNELPVEPNNFRLPDINSTQIRKHLEDREFERLKYWMPHRVLTYISNHDLYLS